MRPLDNSPLLRFRAAGTDAPLLEGRLGRPERPASPPRIAALCHPHPAFGGNMDVWLLPAIAARLQDAGWLVLRFNVRGVGGSEPGPGSWDGVEERHDVGGALAALREHAGATPARSALVGWSFGALLALLAGLEDETVTDWVGIAPPTRPLPHVRMAATPCDRLRSWRANRVVVVGEHDQYYPPASTTVLGADAVHVVPGADHFLFDQDRTVAGIVATALAGDAPRAGSA